MYRLLKILLLGIVVSGCTPEINIRGIPDPTWNKLSIEQKQLIIDQSFTDDMKKTID